MAGTRRARARAASGPVSPAQIEREAIRLFSEKTYPMVGMRDISDAVNLLPGSLYVHITSKEDLLLTIVERGIGIYLSALSPIAQSDKPTPDRIRDIISTYLRVLDANLDITRIAMFQWRYLNGENLARVLELRNQVDQIFVRVVEDGISTGEFPSVRHPRIVAIGVLGLLGSIAQWYSARGELSADEIAEQLADVVLGGLTS